MMPVIRISDTTYRLLQKHAVAFEDSQDSVVMRMAEFYDQHHKQSTDIEAVPTNNNERTPDLRFTKVLDARFGNWSVNNWNNLLKEALIQAWKQARDFDALQRMTSANITPGKRSDCGYKHIPEIDIDISYQGVDAASAWELSKEIAQQLQVPLEVTFMWRNKKGAARPGEINVLRWVPESD